MLGYGDFTRLAPPASSTEERDQWFREHGYEPHDLIRVGQEVAQYRLADLSDGDKLSANELMLAMTLAFTFGFELGVRCERDEAPDLIPPSNGSAPE